jgi:hypothetical protein
MFRFSIRDVLWLTVVVALAICWYRDRAALERARNEIRDSKDAFKVLKMKLHAPSRTN